MKKVELLPTRDCKAGYGPAYNLQTALPTNISIPFLCSLNNLL